MDLERGRLKAGKPFRDDCRNPSEIRGGLREETEPPTYLRGSEGAEGKQCVWPEECGACVAPLTPRGS